MLPARGDGPYGHHEEPNRKEYDVLCGEGGPLVDVLSIYVDTHGDELFIQAGLTRPIDTCIPLLLVLYFFLDLLYRHLTRLLEHNFSSDGHTEG